MRGLIYCFILLAFATSYAKAQNNNTINGSSSKIQTLHLYSAAVNDSFNVYVKLPKSYDAKERVKYPVVYVLDANFFFNMLSATITKYTDVDMLPPVILVGIGYKSMELMDSLRERDYTYPKGEIADSMTASGGANAFLTFIETQLVPQIDKQCNTDINNRIIIGHSLGGYFVSYCLLQNIGKQKPTFQYYIAASTSLDYSHEYLIQEFGKLKITDIKHRLTFYTTIGGLEDEGDGPPTTNQPKSNDLFNTYSQKLHELESPLFRVKTDNYCTFYHMDTALPSFTKGLQWMSNLPTK